MKRNLLPKNASVASLLLVSAVSSNAFADESDFIYRVSIDGKMNVPQWIVDDYIYGVWGDAGSPHSCGEWGIPTSSVDWGESFQQSRLCKQGQTRLETPVLFNPVLKTTKEGVSTRGSRDVSITEFRPNIGTLDFIDDERIGDYNAWNRQSANYDCENWSPKPSERNLFQTFTQSRTCSKDESRTRDVYHVWASGKETFKRTDKEDRTVNDIESQQSTGSKDYISGANVGDWSQWQYEGSPYDCDSWSPSRSAVNLNQQFQQSRTCSQKQISDRDIMDVWRSGKETFNRSEVRSSETIVNQSKSNVGTKDYVTRSSTTSWSGWSNVGQHYGCGLWSPSPSTVDYGRSFTQNRACSQSQTRYRTDYYDWASGARTYGSRDTDSRTVSVTESRPATGTKSLVVGSESNKGAWYYTANASCGGWTPSSSSMNYGSQFTQSQSCSRPRERKVTNYTVWSNGDKKVSSTTTETDLYTYQNSRSVTGSKDYVVSSGWNYSYNYSYSNWACSSWSPSAWSIPETVMFTQTRSCSRTKNQEKRYYNNWKVKGIVYSGSTSVHKSEQENKTESARTWGEKPAMCGNYYC